MAFFNLKRNLVVCAPIEYGSLDQMVASMNEAKAEGADLVEFPISFSSNTSQLDKLIKQRTLPAILSFRTGGNSGSKKTSLQVLKMALQSDVEFVEMEYEVASDIAIAEHKPLNSQIIVSSYVNGSKPSSEKLSNLIACMQSIGADVIKLIVEVHNIIDVAPIFHMLTHCQVPLIATAVGSRGLISQLLAPKFGGFLVYGYLKSHPIPGLPTLVSLKQTYELEHVNEYTKIFGLISNPVGHSKGPILHNPALRHIRYNGIYVPMMVDNVNEFFQTYTSMDFAGFSVGIPHKEEVVKCCDEVHPLAKSIGAVNTIVRRPSDGKLIGYNTDSEACITAIEDALRERAKALALAVSGEALPSEVLDSFCPEKGMIFANASSIGMEPYTNESPISKAALGAYDLVFDAVYTPKNTRLLQEAAEVGAVVVSGVEMFIRQAIGQFSLFTGGPAPEDVMRKLVQEQF
ncbi:hypothetical protein G4B88_030106 [Cannabis sativa]|uniref:Uncharacterized protein n=1 Tax=Cannabis sativa TaxID=3483 RepID=A0A7J6DWQ5_CANSA|nr:hypothetical protein G4B88_030106 [Cannabis sativa]